MRFKIEEEKEKGKILLIFKNKNIFITNLVKKLTSYGYTIFHCLKTPPQTDKYKYIFVFVSDVSLFNYSDLKSYSQNTIVILFNGKTQLASLYEFIHKKSLDHIKIININSTDTKFETLDQVIWFALAKTKESILDLQKDIYEKKIYKYGKHQQFFLNRITKMIKKRYLLIILFSLILTIETLFLIPLSISSFFIYQGYRTEIKNDSRGTMKNLAMASPFLQLTDSCYQIARPVLSFFFLALKTDNLVALPQISWELLDKSVEINKNTSKIISLILDKDLSPAEKTAIRSHFINLEDQINTLKNLLENLSDKLDFPGKKIADFKNKLSSIHSDISKITPIIENIDAIIGSNEKKRYLVLFQNNMEIRPGGGFIGSFALLTFSNYSLEDIYVEDVYEADGQLKAHVEPPAAIRKYLQQPHWFLRDSNFSPDFEENFNQAEFFLDKEIGLKNLDGGVAITTTAISYILEGLQQLYIPDYDEILTPENFYIKTQTHSEKDFFPGSKQKKNFLSSVVDTMIQNIQSVPAKKIVKKIKQGLDEKHIVIFLKNKQTQKVIDSLGYSGSVIIPQCPDNKKKCIADTILPVDANLGINKANFFLTRLMNLKINILPDGKIENIYTINFTNNAQSQTFPGGTYKNYFQMYLPKNITIKKMLYNGKDTSFTNLQQTDSFSIVSYYFELSPKSSSVLQIHYLLKDKITSGQNLYQLIVQKQIGSNNNDFVLEMYLPKNITISDNNFAALAKDEGIIYNTSLSTDRIFFIDLIRKN